MSGLVINTNMASIRALRNLYGTDRLQMRSMERLATGLKINRASDDPSGMVISEQLRAQLRALRQGVENSQNAANLIATTEAALQEISHLLIEIKGSITFALSVGGTSPEQIAAEQDAVDSAVAAIARIVDSTRFADNGLINGVASYRVTAQSGEITNLRVRQVNFVGLPSRTFEFTVAVAPEQARINLGTVTTVGPVTLRIQGNIGTRDIQIPSGVNARDVAVAINNVTGFTGVWASGTAGTGGVLNVFSVDYGTAHVATIQVVATSAAGSFRAGGISYSVPHIWSDSGRNAVLTLGGENFEARGLQFNINTAFLNAEFRLQEQIAWSIGTRYSFTITRSGLEFQLRERPLPSDILSIGIENLGPGLLGMEPIYDIAGYVAGKASGSGIFSTLHNPAGRTVGGFLNSLISGSRNDLTTNPTNASKIVEAAVVQVNTLRGFLGAVQAFMIEPNIRSTEVAVENLTAMESTIRDLDFATETAGFTRHQILYQSGIAVLASANMIPQAVLRLLVG